MQIGRVVDEVVSVHHHPALAGQKLLLVQPLALDRETPLDRPPLVAVDTVGAGRGALVLTCEEGRAARIMLNSDSPPVRTLILGIVDDEPTESPERRS